MNKIFRTVCSLKRLEIYQVLIILMFFILNNQDAFSCKSNDFISNSAQNHSKEIPKAHIKQAGMDLYVKVPITGQVSFFDSSSEIYYENQLKESTKSIDNIEKEAQQPAAPRSSYRRDYNMGEWTSSDIEALQSLLTQARNNQSDAQNKLKAIAQEKRKIRANLEFALNDIQTKILDYIQQSKKSISFLGATSGKSIIITTPKKEGVLRQYYEIIMELSPELEIAFSIFLITKGHDLAKYEDDNFTKELGHFVYDLLREKKYKIAI